MKMIDTIQIIADLCQIVSFALRIYSKCKYMIKRKYTAKRKGEKNPPSSFYMGLCVSLLVYSVFKICLALSKYHFSFAKS